MNEKLEKLLENILTELQTLNKNVRGLKEKDELEILATWLQMLRGIECLQDCRYAPLLRENKKANDILVKLSETITEKIFKLAPKIKS